MDIDLSNLLVPAMMFFTHGLYTEPVPSDL